MFPVRYEMNFYMLITGNTVQGSLEVSATMTEAVECRQPDSQSEVRGFNSRIVIHS
jgi:hypothetical protein